MEEVVDELAPDDGLKEKSLEAVRLAEILHVVLLGSRQACKELLVVLLCRFVVRIAVELDGGQVDDGVGEGFEAVDDSAVVWTLDEGGWVLLVEALSLGGAQHLVQRVDLVLLLLDLLRLQRDVGLPLGQLPLQGVCGGATVILLSLLRATGRGLSMVHTLLKSQQHYLDKMGGLQEAAYSEALVLLPQGMNNGGLLLEYGLIFGSQLAQSIAWRRHHRHALARLTQLLLLVAGTLHVHVHVHVHPHLLGLVSDGDARRRRGSPLLVLGCRGQMKASRSASGLRGLALRKWLTVHVLAVPGWELWKPGNCLN